MEYPKPEEHLFNFRRRGPEAFERLIDADRSGLLPYVRRITFKVAGGSFDPENMQKYLPRLRSITNLRSLTLIFFNINPFIPVFNECFGMFTDTLRHLEIRNTWGMERQLLYIISQFSLLEDLSIVFPTLAVERSEHPVPAITRSPPLRGTLVLAKAYSREFSEGLAALPGGLNSRSLELFRCGGPQFVLVACSHSVTSISYLWCARNSGYGSESDPCVRMSVAI